jgi:hypothetical protein
MPVSGTVIAMEVSDSSKRGKCAPTHFDTPAPIYVCGLLVVAALMRVDDPHWAIVGMISV